MWTRNSLRLELSARRNPWCVWPLSMGCRLRCEWRHWAYSQLCIRLDRSSRCRGPPSGHAPPCTAEGHQSHPTRRQATQKVRMELKKGHLYKCSHKTVFSPGMRLGSPLYLWSQHKSWSPSHGHPRTSSADRSYSQWLEAELGSAPQQVTHFLSHLRFTEEE